MCDADKRFARMLAGAFNEAIAEQHGPQNLAASSKPMLDYGRELMGMPEQGGMALMWYGFYLGFGKGAEFMAAAQEDPDAARAALGVEE